MGRGDDRSGRSTGRRSKGNDRHSGTRASIASSNSSILKFCGFRGIVEVGNIPYNVGFISALVERWRPETHTFHLRIGEATITLQNIEIMFGMVVDGSPILLEDCFSGIRRILVSKLAAYVKELDDITDDTPEIEVQQRVRLYLLWLYEGTLFPDKSKSKISLDYLIDLQDLNAMSTKAWGAAVLSFLYYSLCRASISSYSDVCEFFVLVQVWAWERIIPLQPAPHPLGANHHDASAPLARTWRRGIVHENEARNILVIIRDVLDNLTIEKAMGHEIIYRMAQLILCDSRATSEMYGFALEVVRISSKSMNFAYRGTRLSIAPNYAPPTQSAESSPMQVCRQGRQSASRYSTHQGRRGGRRADNFGLSLDSRCAI
ncbi:putative DEAD-box ATP-dependent RNA helicase 7-like [Capsicum annuum]|nr:putative DEAD-box ATP-dependent RNA helicase 7-like [Capsicum annuum]KAF3657177.1 putative DEAD-box ATP-dependent RNA helicase 7-like [Capsicum annuum]